MTSIPEKPSWSPDDPATPALIPYVFAEHYDEPYDELAPSELDNYQKALNAAREYCVLRIKFRNEMCCGDPMLMGEMSEEAAHFLCGFMAALSGQVRALGC